MEWLFGITAALGLLAFGFFQWGGSSGARGQVEEDLEDANEELAQAATPLPDPDTRARAAMRRLRERFPNIAKRVSRTGTRGAGRDRNGTK